MKEPTNPDVFDFEAEIDAGLETFYRTHGKEDDT